MGFGGRVAGSRRGGAHSQRSLGRRRGWALVSWVSGLSRCVLHKDASAAPVFVVCEVSTRLCPLSSPLGNHPGDLLCKCSPYTVVCPCASARADNLSMATEKPITFSRRVLQPALVRIFRLRRRFCLRFGRSGDSAATLECSFVQILLLMHECGRLMIPAFRAQLRTRPATSARCGRRLRGPAWRGPRPPQVDSSPEWAGLLLATAAATC